MQNNATAAISFNQIPANIRNPLFYAEVSNEQAGYFVQNSRVMIIGQATGAPVEAPVLIPSSDFSRATFGAGSQLDVMINAFLANPQNSTLELWALPLADAVGATAATNTLTYTGSPTASGTLYLYIGANVVYVPVGSADTVAAIALATVAAVNAQTQLPVTASALVGVVTFTAKNKGTVGNSLQIQLNFRGAIAGENKIPGLTTVLTEAVGGATDPNMVLKLPLIGSMEVAFYGHPYSTTIAIGAFTTFLANRWHALGGNQDGHAFTALQGSLSALQTFGLTLNDQHQTVVGFEVTSPSWALEVLGAFLGQSAFSLAIDPARTLQTLTLGGIIPPPEGARFTLQNRSVLLNSGIATLKYNRNDVQIERAVTTYQLNSWGQADPSYLDVMTLISLTYIKKSVGYLITQKFPRSKLAPDGTVFGAGQAIVTPKIIRNELIAWYDQMNFIGICVKPEDFATNLLVSLNPSDPNRVDILLPPTLIGNLVIAATKVEFRLH